MEIQVADGRTIDVDTDDEEVAISVAFKWSNDNPLPEIDPTQQAAQLGEEDVSTLGDVLKAPVAGLVSAVSGAVSLPAELIDLVSQDEGEESLAEGVRDIFDTITPTTRTGAGKAVKFATQFIVPGGLAARAAKLRNFGKTGEIGAFGAADVVATTPDVETLGDFFEGGPTQRIDTEDLEASELAAANLINRFKVASEGTALLLAGPAVIKALAKGTGPVLNKIAKNDSVQAAANSVREKILDNVGIKPDLNDANFLSRNIRNLSNKVKKGIFFKGEFPDDATQKLNHMKIHSISRANKSVRNNVEEINHGLIVLNKNGLLNDVDEANILDAITDFIYPINKGQTSRETVRANASKTLKDADELFKKVPDKRKLLYGTKSIFGVDKELSLFNAADRTRNEITNLSRAVSDLYGVKSPLNEALKKVIDDNEAFYGRTVYRAMKDPTFDPLRKADGTIDPAKQTKFDLAVDNIYANNLGGKSEFSIDDAKEQLGEILRNVKTFSNSNMKPNDMFDDETLKGIATGILKEKKLDNLPAVRDFLGEYSGSKNIMGVVGRTKNADGTLKIGKIREQTLDEQRVGLQNKVSETVSKMTNMIEQVKFFDNIKKHSDNLTDVNKKFIFNAPPANAALDEFSPIGSATKKEDLLRYGPLAGQYVKTEYLRAFTDIPTYINFANAGNPASRLYATFLGMKGMSQIAKTVYSPITQIRNATTAALFAIKNGNFGNGEDLVNSAKVVFSKINDNIAFSKGGAEFKASGNKIATKSQINDFYNEMVSRGVVNTNAKVGEFEDLLGDAVKAGYAPGFTKKVLAAAQNTQNRFSGKLYQGSDDIWKIYSYQMEMGRLKKAFDNSSSSFNVRVTAGENLVDDAVMRATSDGFVDLRKVPEGFDVDEFLKRESSEIVKDTVPNYSRVPTFIKELRQMPFGNFIAFPAEIIRTSGNIYGRAIRELASDSPEIRSIGMRRLMGSLTVDGALGAGLVTAGLTLTGTSREQLEAYKRSFAADYDRDSILIPVSEKDGKIREVYNFSYTNPYDYFTRPARAVFNAVNDGITAEKDLTDIFMSSAWEGMVEMFAPFAGESIVTEKAFDLVRNQTRYGRSVWGEADPLGLRISKGFAHMADGLTPGISPIRLRGDVAGQDIQLGDFTLGADIGDFPKAIGLAVGLDPVTGVNRKGERIDAAGEFAEALTGLKFIKPKVDLTLMYRGYEASSLVREASGIFNRVAKSKTGMSPEDITQAYIVSNEQRFKALRDLNMAIEDARTLGLSDSEIAISLKKAKTPNLNEVMAGKFKPFFPSEETIGLAMQAQDNKMSNPFDFGEMSKIYGEQYGKNLLPGRAEAQSEARTRELKERMDQASQQLQASAPQPPEIQIPEPTQAAPAISPGVAALRQVELNKLLGI